MGLAFAKVYTCIHLITSARRSHFQFLQVPVNLGVQTGKNNVGSCNELADATKIKRTGTSYLIEIHFPAFNEPFPALTFKS